MIEIVEYPFVECRAMGHEWRHRGQVTERMAYRPPAGWVAVGYLSQCTNCRGWRARWISRSGEVANRYFPPSGYSRKGAQEATTMREWRTYYVASAFDKFTTTHKETA